MIRNFLMLSTVGVVSMFAVAACSSSDSTSNNNGNDSGTTSGNNNGSDGSAGDGGTGTGGSTGNGDGGSTSTGNGEESIAQCLNGGGVQTTQCEAAQTCDENKCDSQLKAAFGDSYASGTLGGPCASFVTCVQQKGCGQSAEEACISSLTSDCQTALQNFSTCDKSNCQAEEDACSSSEADAGTTMGDAAADAGLSAACMQLEACCATLPSGDQDECTAAASSNNDSECQQALAAAQAQGACSADGG